MYEAVREGVVALLFLVALLPLIIFGCCFTTEAMKWNGIHRGTDKFGKPPVKFAIDCTKNQLVDYYEMLAP